MAGESGLGGRGLFVRRRFVNFPDTSGEGLGGSRVAGVDGERDLPVREVRTRRRFLRACANRRVANVPTGDKGPI